MTAPAPRVESQRRNALPASVLHPLELPAAMTATDALFWHAESALPIFRPLIAGLYVLDRRPDARRMAGGLEAAMRFVPRLRQRVVEQRWPGLPQWIDDPHFDAAYHVRHISLPAPGTQRELLDLCATLFAAPLDRERPLWEAYWIDGVSGHHAAFFFKLHHSVVDGVGAITLLQGMTQASAAAEIPRVVRRAALARVPLNGSAGGAASAVRALTAGLRASLRLVADPGEAVTQVVRAVRGARGMVSDLFTTPVRDPLAEHCSGLSRRFDVMQIPLARLRRIKTPLEVTINDVILAALAAALGAYHRERHVPVDALNCMVPMNLRSDDERHALGNRVGTFTVRLPLAERDPARRLRLVTAQTRAAKGDRRSGAAALFLQAVELLPGPAFRWLARQSLGKVNIACTNIPGVPERRYIAGARVDAIYPFASVVEGTPAVIALLSYAGVMHVGIDTDPEAIPDPARLHTLFDDALAELERLARVAKRPRPSRR